MKLDSSVTYNHYEISPDTRYIWDQAGVTNGWYMDDYKYGIGESYTLEETARIELAEKLSMIAGAMAASYNIIPKSTIPGGADTSENIDSQGGNFTYSYPGSPSKLYQIPQVTRSTYQSYAGYMEFDWKIFDDLKLIAGARLTKDSRFPDAQFSPRAALVYDLTKELTAKYIYTKAYVEPAPYFADAVYDNGTQLATQNPNVKPEQSESHEVNFSYNRKNFSLGLSAYIGSQKDLIIYSDQNLPQNVVAPVVYLNGNPNDPRTLVETANGGDSRNFGADFYGRATIGPLSPWFSYSYTDFSENNNGVKSSLPGISAHNGRLGTTWAVTHKFYITPAFVIRSTPENVNGGVLEHDLKNPWQADLYVLYSLSPHYDIYLDLRNVTDHHYALGGINGDAVPQETFNGEAGLRATF